MILKNLFFLTSILLSNIDAHNNDQIFYQFPEIPKPQINEEYFEWIDLMEAISNSKNQFVMIEIGAGDGRWAVNGARCARSINKDFKLYLVEAEPHRCFETIPKNMNEHNISMSSYQVFDYAIALSDDYTFFYIQNDTLNLQNWYGQCIWMDTDSVMEWTGEELYGHPLIKTKYGYTAVAVNQSPLSKILQKIPEQVIDLCDFDIQGMEFFAIKESINSLNERVVRMHIGTHSHEIEIQLEKFLPKNGWQKIRAYPCLGRTNTELGQIDFVDGVQSWVNKRFIK